jgi:Holliday junction resolvase-like predicted endonuclease
MAEDIGESLVGAYLRYIEGCDLVVHNTQLSKEQGEIDVLGLKLGTDAKVIFAEVTTHVLGMQYGSYDSTVKKVVDKIQRARDYAKDMFPEERPRYEIWSPVVPKGKLTDEFEALEAKYSDQDLNVCFVINEIYTSRVRELVERAKHNPKATSDPAYRLLQILVRLKGDTGL